MQTKQKPGRKPVDPSEKKTPITIYIKLSDIKSIGGKPVVRDHLLNHINTLVYANN